MATATVEHATPADGSFTAAGANAWNGTGAHTVVIDPDISVNAQTGTSYTLLASDNGGMVTLSNAAAITLTVPTGLGKGFNCLIKQLGAGVVTVTASGTTLQSRGSLVATNGQYAVAALVAHQANTFSLSGDLA